jgi:DNA-binding CsgD family transcriptional regulator
VHAGLPEGPATEPGSVGFLTAVALLRVAAGLALDAGELVDAKAWLEAHDRWMRWSESPLGRADGGLLWAAYYRASGDAVVASRRADQALEQASNPRQPLALLGAHRLLGELATDAGRSDAARTHLAAALTLADACALPFERALVLLAWAALHAATGEYSDALALLDEVRALCLPLGAAPTLASVDALVARIARATAPRRDHPAGLSSREVEVLRLIAAGRTNREIAAALFLSPATVNIHVTHILAKTDTANRAAAAAFALRHGLA